MRRCDHWGGKFDLAAHRKWRLRLCTLACKNSQEPRRHEDSQHRRRWLDACGLKLVAAAILRRFRATREQVGFGVLALNLICNPVEAYCALDSLASIFPEKAQAKSFGRPSPLRAVSGLPPADPQIGSSQSLSSERSVSRLSIILQMASRLPNLPSTSATILHRTSARIAEYFYQRLAPVIEGSLSGDVTAGQGIGVRLAGDSARLWITQPTSLASQADVRECTGRFAHDGGSLASLWQRDELFLHPSRRCV